MQIKMDLVGRAHIANDTLLHVVVVISGGRHRSRRLLVVVMFVLSSLGNFRQETGAVIKMKWAP